MVNAFLQLGELNILATFYKSKSAIVRALTFAVVP